MHYANIPVRQLNSFCTDANRNLAYCSDPSRIYDVLAASGAFDEDFYNTMYSDVAAADIDPLYHYINFGWKEGRNPNLWFDSRFYMDSNPDLASQIANPLLHFIYTGYRDGLGANPMHPRRIKRLVLLLMATQASLPDAVRMLKNLYAREITPELVIISLPRPDDGRISHPDALFQLLKMGAQIRPWPQNELSRLLEEAFKDYQDDLLVLVQPLAALPHDWLASLYAAWHKQPDKITAMRRAFAVLKNGRLDMERAAPGDGIALSLPILTYGLLLPPKCIQSLLANISYYGRYAPDFPGIWFAVQSLLDDRPLEYLDNLPGGRIQPSLDLLESRKFTTQLKCVLSCFRRELDQRLSINTIAELFSAQLAKNYEYHMHERLDWNNLRTFSQKMQYLKLWEDLPLKTLAADKYNARKYIRAVAGPEYVVPLYGVWKNFDDINFKVLPSQFVLKTTHGSGQVLMVENKRTLDRKDAREKIEKWQASNLVDYGYEFNYFDIEPLIICEKYLASNISDYKILCFHGEPLFLFVTTDRFTDLRFTFFDTDWQRINVKYVYKSSDQPIPKPVNFELMLELAKKLAAPFIHTRVDFFVLPDNSLKVGEITFYTFSGFKKIEPYSKDQAWGELITLPH